jgi:hypothetical protein
MSRTISGTYSTGITLSASDNPVTITTSGTISTTGATGLYAYEPHTLFGTPVTLIGWTITNSGLLSATYNGFFSSGVGIQVGSLYADSPAGTNITNTSSGRIYGYGYGILIVGTGRVVNSGSIGGHRDGVEITGAGTVTNSGTIAGLGGYQSGSPFSGSGVQLDTAGSTLTNSGTIIGGVGVFLDSGIINNSGKILGTSSTFTYVGFSGTFTTVYDAIGVEANGSSGGNTLVNSGTINGAAGTTIVNGTITSTIAATAVSLAGGNNLVVMKPGAVFGGIVNAGTGKNTLELASGVGLGTLQSFSGFLSGKYIDFTTLKVDSGAKWLLSGSSVIDIGVTLDNQGSLTNTGLITNLGGTVVDSGRLLNFGYINSSVTLASGGYFDNSLTRAGVAGTLVSSDVAVQGPASGAATVFNKGTISADQGIRLPGGGTAVNDGGTISANLSGIYIAGGSAINTGTIKATGGFGGGVFLASGASLDNNGGLIQAPVTGVYNYSGLPIGTITNSGTIAATGTSGIGVLIHSLVGAATLVNSGTISGASGTAAEFIGGFYHLVALGPGATFSGIVNAGTSGDGRLRLATGASTGTLSSFPTNFIGFKYVSVESAAQWVLSSNNLIDTGVTLTDSGTLTASSGTLTNLGSIAANGILALDFGTLVNSGSITGKVRVLEGSELDNETGARIANSYGNAVYGSVAAGAIVNSGSISAVGTAAVLRVGGGNVTNSLGGVITASGAGYYGGSVSRSPPLPAPSPISARSASTPLAST